MYIGEPKKGNWEPLETECPYCGSREVQHEGGMCTLIGYTDGDPDPNHHNEACECKKCEKRFVRHWKYSNQSYWVTDEACSKLLAGEPGCFETYDR